MNEPTKSDLLLKLASHARVPVALTEAGRRDRFGELRDLEVRRGQLWRAAWDDTSLLVLILEVGQVDATVVPVTIDPPAEDEQCFVLEPAATVFGVAATVWMGPRGELPVRVLDVVVDQLPDELVDSLETGARTSARELPWQARPGMPIQSEFDSAAAVRADVIDDLDVLRSSPALLAEVEGQRTPTLAQVLKEDLNLPVILDALRPLGLNQAEVMGILRGTRPITPDQARAVADCTGVPQELVSKAVQPLPADLAAEAERPRWRRTWRALAEQDGVDEADARLAAAYGAFTLAARQTGSGAPDWAGRLEQFIQAKRSRGQ